MALPERTRKMVYMSAATRTLLQRLAADSGMSQNAVIAQALRKMAAGERRITRAVAALNGRQ